LTLPRQLAENTSVFSPDPEKSTDMVSSLAKRIAVAMLMMALLGAPVLASVPTCCSKGAAAGKTCCCRSQQSAQPNNTEPTKSCCSKAKACCGAEKVVAASAIKPPASTCSCKARRSIPAIPEEQSRPELRVNPMLVVGIAVDRISVLPMTMGLPALGQVNSEPRPARQVLYCRWLI
jgi:hypothetical protein